MLKATKFRKNNELEENSCTKTEAFQPPWILDIMVRQLRVGCKVLRLYSESAINYTSLKLAFPYFSEVVFQL